MPRKEYLELAGDGVYRIVLGLLYKIVLSTYVYQMLLALNNTGTVVYSIKYMYLYTLYLFFDFAGYSLMAVGSSNILGIQTPMNFNKPFLSVDIKDFLDQMAYHLVDLVERFCIFKSIDAGYQEKMV